MKERPILFSGEMVKAILEGRKTQTRRIVKPQPITSNYRFAYGRIEKYYGYPLGHDVVPCPYGEAGERLWVREMWQPLWATEEKPPKGLKSSEGWQINYPATDGITEWHDMANGGIKTACRPSIHMPRWASRINLEIIGVRVEFVKDISEADARAEGAQFNRWYRPVGKPEGDSYNIGAAGSTYNVSWERPCYRNGFASLWDSINAARGYGWDTNPCVWVVEFKRIEAVAA